MADNTILTAGSGGDSIRDVDRGGIKTPVSLLDKGAAGGAESLVSDQNPLPVVLRNSAGTEYTALPASDSGPSWSPVRGNVSSADLSAAADLTAAPTVGQKIVIDDLWISIDTARRVDLIEETSGTVLWSVYLPANGGVQFTPRDGLKLDTVNKKARLQASGAGNIRATVLYHSAA